MKPTVKYGIIFAFAWIIVKLSFLQLGWTSENHYFVAACLNILGLLLAIAFGLWKNKEQQPIGEESNALQDIKNAMTSAVVYSVIVSLFIFIYYSSIDDSFFNQKIQEVSTQLQDVISDPQKLKELKSSNQEFEVMTVQEIYDKQMENPKLLFSPKFITTLSLLGLIFMSTLYSILVTIIYRKIIFKNR